MSRLKKYYIGYLAWDWSIYPSAPYKGKGWNITFTKTDQCKLHRAHYNGKSMESREVTINAPSFVTAQNALDLVNCAIPLVSGQPSIAEIGTVRPADKKEFEEIFRDDPALLSPKYSGTSHYPLACIAAAKASHRRAYKYALGKFRFASQLHSLFIVDLDPSHATEHLGISPYFINHVRYAYSIIASYSVIEELGLEIRATRDKPSTINGQWNPPVKQDLEDRLRKAKIDLNNTVLWSLRGKPTRIEKAKPLPASAKKWAKGPYVRDVEIDVVDAILQASFLRSKISSHKLDERVSSLSSYDVENVRHLARRLLLDRLGVSII